MKSSASKGAWIGLALVVYSAGVFYLSNNYFYNLKKLQDAAISKARHWQEIYDLSRAGESAKVQEKAVHQALMALLPLASSSEYVFGQGTGYTLVTPAELQKLVCWVIGEGRKLNGHYLDSANRLEDYLKKDGFIAGCNGKGKQSG